MERAFIESEESFFDKVPSPLFRVEFDGRRYVFTDANAAGHLLTGGRITDLYGREIFSIWSTPENRHIAERLKQAHVTGQKQEESFWHTFVSDGKRRYVNISYVPHGRNTVLMFLYDLTDEVNKTQTLSRLDARYRALFERGSTGILEGVPEKFADCNKQLSRLFGYTRQQLLKLRLKDICHPADRPGLLSLLQSISANPFAVYPWRGRGVRKDGSPFWVSASITGILGEEGDLQHYLASMDDISEQHEAALKLQNALVDTVKAVAATVEIHDRYTAGHMERVAEISVQLGRQLGLSNEELLGISLGASIHDIGKVGIPSAILSKPGRLSAAEFELIKEHPALGAEVIKNIEFGWPVKEMILQHHERLDGSGYPAGLKGDDITREAKIIAVADVFEALISHRPYRAGFDLEKSLQILQQEKGRLVPDYVDCLVGLVRQGKVRQVAPKP